ncbi:hypothetical protein GCWU000282_02293 [Catonella morbi ATCC 51271]|uniref:Uncharacterized protein n=2 Tax=Catonella TaxID=43996 RepID=V2XJ39_9FIRM|nr:hypothetical protein GCWU000282_02293 [Catonella morbi ATCC 51271]
MRIDSIFYGLETEGIEKGGIMSELREKTLVTTREEVTSEYPFHGDLPMIYLGEIANMKEHGIFVGKSGKCYFGYHISNFRELSEEEV